MVADVVTDVHFLNFTEVGEFNKDFFIKFLKVSDDFLKVFFWEFDT